jgi:hypothetical protein
MKGSVSTKEFSPAKSVDLEDLIAYFRDTLGHGGPLTVHWCLCRSQVGEYGGKAELGNNNQIITTIWSAGSRGSDGLAKEPVKAPVRASKRELAGIVEVRTFADCSNPTATGEKPQVATKQPDQLDLFMKRRAERQQGQGQVQGATTG